MSNTRIFQLDAFSDGPFTGNPAAVCLMERDAEDTWMQSVAAEMNLSETAFVWKRNDDFQLRWFTPETEVDLCGHATLATSHVLWHCGWLPAGQDATFQTRSGHLIARQVDDMIQLDFPSQPPIEQELPDGIIDSISLEPLFGGTNGIDFMIEVENETALRNVLIDFSKLGIHAKRGLILTAPADAADVDFVSRFFAPAAGIDEDPVTGSAHCCLTPFWAGRLGKNRLVGYQASKRGGYVHVQLNGERVMLSGHTTLVMEGSLLI